MAEQATVEQDHEGGPGEDVPAPVGPGPGEGSLLDQLAAERDEIAHEQTVDLPVPNNREVLWATYRLLPYAQTRALAEQAQGGDAAQELNAGCDLIAAACDGLWLRSPETRERAPWPEGTAEPVRYTPALAALLQIDLPAGAGHREVIRLALLRDLAVTVHAGTLLRWMQGATKRVNDEFSGG
jgi:hypothetical protein